MRNLWKTFLWASIGIFCFACADATFAPGDIRLDKRSSAKTKRLKTSPTIRIPVIVIKVANDDGTHDSDPTFSDETVEALIDDTNAIYGPDAGIGLVLEDIQTLNNTLINRLRDWSLDTCPDAAQTQPNPNPNFPNGYLSPSQLAAYEHADSNYPGRIAVYIRRQTYDNNCLVVDDNGGGFSHADLNFIALSSWGPAGLLGVPFDPANPLWQAPHSYLAHELGHYLDLTHPMPNDWPENQADATAQMDQFCQQHPALIAVNLPDRVWDGDQLSDTPGDTGFTLYNREQFGIGPGLESNTENQCLGTGQFHVVSQVCRTIGGLTSDTFVVHPARENVMSYTAGCPYLPGNTTGETRARITPLQRAVVHNSLNTIRKDLVKDAQLADLVISQHYVAGCAHAGAPVRFWARVKNQGGGLSRLSTVVFKIGGESHPKTYDIPRLPKDGSFLISRQATLRAGNYRNTVTVDVDNDTEESNENNNEAFFRYSVAKSCPPPKPTGLELMPHPKLQGRVLLRWDSMANVDKFIVERRKFLIGAGYLEAGSWEVGGAQNSFLTPPQQACHGHSYRLFAVKDSLQSLPAGPAGHTWNDGTCLAQ